MNAPLTKAGVIAAGDLAGLTLILRTELIKGMKDIPIELKDRKCWLVYKVSRIDPVTGKFGKIPDYPCSRQRRHGKQGSEADRAMLGTYNEAVSALNADPSYAGIGIAMLKECGIVALDFDGCIINDHVIPEVQNLLSDTYSEISPSGKGVRAFMRGYLPSRKSPSKGNKFGFETFSDNGFVTITGNLTDACELLGTQNIIQDVTPEILALYEERLGPGPGVATTYSRVSDDPLMTYVPKVGLPLAELRGYVLQLDPNCGYIEDSPKGISWLKIGMGIHHETDGSGEGLELFDEWSKGSKDKYPGRAAIEAKWRSFSVNPRKSVTARSIQRHVNMQKAEKDGVPVLNPKDPLACALMIYQAKFQADDGYTLVRYKDTWYEHRGACYEMKSESEIRALAWNYMGSSIKHGPNGALVPASPNKSQVDGVVDALKGVAQMGGGNPPFWRNDCMGANPHELVSLENGLLHIPSRQLMLHTPGLFTLNALPYSWDEDIEPTNWLKFLEQVWPGDKGSQQALQEMFGYCLTADTSQQKMFLIVGPRRSGKGTIGRVLSALLGRENVASPTLTSLTGSFGLQPLIGKLVALVPDARIGGHTNVQGVVERLLMVSGEDMITVDRKNRESWTGNMSARFVFLTNEIPQLGDASGALSGRFITIAMRETFYGREDPGLTGRLLTELPAIFKWAIEGRERLQKRGYFLQPQSGEEDAEELAEISSPIMAFVNEMCDLGPACTVAIGDLYNAWGQWCQVRGRNNPGMRSTLGRNLRAALPKIRRTRPRLGEERERRYEGIRLKSGNVDEGV